MPFLPLLVFAAGAFFFGKAINNNQQMNDLQSQLQALKNALNHASNSSRGNILQQINDIENRIRQL